MSAGKKALIGAAIAIVVGLVSYFLHIDLKVEVKETAPVASPAAV